MSNKLKNKDWNLLDLYMKGNREAGNILFAQIYLPLKAFVFDRAQDLELDIDDCSDIITESMKRALEKIHYYTGDFPFKNKEICKLTGKSEATVDSMYRRAISALKKNYKTLEK